MPLPVLACDVAVLDRRPDSGRRRHRPAWRLLPARLRPSPRASIAAVFVIEVELPLDAHFAQRAGDRGGLERARAVADEPRGASRGQDRPRPSRRLRPDVAAAASEASGRSDRDAARRTSGGLLRPVFARRPVGAPGGGLPGARSPRAGAAARGSVSRGLSGRLVARCHEARADRAAAGDRELEDTLLPKSLALPIFSSDPISSVAYATEAALAVLVASLVVRPPRLPDLDRDRRSSGDRRRSPTPRGSRPTHRAAAPTSSRRRTSGRCRPRRRRRAADGLRADCRRLGGGRRLRAHLGRAGARVAPGRALARLPRS